MLRRLSTGFSVFSVFVNINIRSLAIQSHAAKLHGSTIDGMVSRHNDSLLLFHDTALRSRSTDVLLECACGQGTSCGAGGG